MGDVTLLFDLDGTLTDNYPGISRSILYALERMGHALPDAAALKLCVGPPLRGSFARLIGTNDKATIERAIALYRERYGDVGWRENIVYEGIADALQLLANDATRMFVCTSKPQVFAHRIAALFELDKHFARVYGVDLDGALDDKAKLIAHIGEREGIALDRAIMIGDREHDIDAARSNGMRAIGVLWGYGTRDELAHADAQVATPQELPAVVAAL